MTKAFPLFTHWSKVPILIKHDPKPLERSQWTRLIEHTSQRTWRNLYAAEQMRIHRLAINCSMSYSIRLTIFSSETGITKLFKNEVLLLGYYVIRRFARSKTCFSKEVWPRRRWMDLVREDMERVGAREGDEVDRVKWRLLSRCGDPE